MKKILFITLSLFALSVQAQKSSDILLGSWKVVKIASAYLNIPLSKKESKQGVGTIVTFKIDRIDVTKNDAGIDGCNNPKYKMRTVNALKYCDNDKGLVKTLGISTKYVKVVETGCGLPCDYILIVRNDLISIGIDGYRYFLKRITIDNIKKSSPK